MINRYINLSCGFESEVFGCRVIIKNPGAILSDAPPVHRLMPNYPKLVLPGGLLERILPETVWAFYPDKITFVGPFVSFVALAQYLNPVKMSERKGYQRSNGKT
jgi:hypothetical protein